MKRFATKTLVLTAALAAVAVGASAASMNVEIPFTFRAGTAVLAAGSYRVHEGSSANGSTVVQLTNRDTKRSVMLAPSYRRDAPKASNGQPKLWCAGSNCVLTTVWNGADRAALVVGSPAHAGKAMAETRVVTMTPVSKSE